MTAEMKLLRRSRTDRKLAGVCAGVGQYLGIDPTVVRVGFVLAAIFTGFWGFLAYPIAWIVMPEEDPAPLPDYTMPQDATPTSGIPVAVPTTNPDKSPYTTI